MKRTITLLFALLLSIAICIPVFANSSPPPDYLVIEMTDFPDDAVYADLLIKIDEQDQKYVDVNEEYVTNCGFSGDEEIITYCEDGFRSFTFHYVNAKSTIKAYSLFDDGIRYVDFCKGTNYRDFVTQYEDLRNQYHNLKIALFDENGKIVSVSQQHRLPRVSDVFQFWGTMQYDVASGNIETATTFNVYILLWGIMLVALLFSVVLEVLTAIFFGFKRKQVGVIAVVNIFTQICMRILNLVMPFTYMVNVIILELLVYSSEYLIYRKAFVGETKRRILIYTVVANTVSLVYGFWLNNMLGL